MLRLFFSIKSQQNYNFCEVLTASFTDFDFFERNVIDFFLLILLSAFVFLFALLLCVNFPRRIFDPPDAFVVEFEFSRKMHLQVW